MDEKRFIVEIRADEYDFEEECWISDEMPVVDVLYFDTFEEAKDFCNALTPMQAMKYEQESSFNGLAIGVYECLGDNDYVMVSAYDWIGMYKVGASMKFQYGIIDIQSGYEECGVADSIFEAMAMANAIEVDFSGLPINHWRYDWECHEWRANTNDEFETPWYIRKIEA